MSRSRIKEARLHGGPSLGQLLTARPSGLTEPECWAILCQAVQALQDLFLSDGASGDSCIPLVTPSTLILSSRGRVKLCQSSTVFGCGPPAHLAGYLAPEYRPNKQCSDTETEKMWIFALGETLKRVTLTSHSATLRLSNELYQVLVDMTKVHVAARASLMYLLEVISDYCKRRQQNRPFSHIVMDLHQEAMAAVELALDTPWGPPAMPELRPRTRNRSESNADGIGTIPRRWISLTRPQDPVPKLTKEASTSMEDLSFSIPISNAPGSLVRPKSMCVPDMRYFNNDLPKDFQFCASATNRLSDLAAGSGPKLSRAERLDGGSSGRRPRMRRNPVQRAASRLYRASVDVDSARDCVGPEFVVRASLPSKQITMPDFKGQKKHVTVIMLNGQKVDVLCNPNTTTAGQLFEAIIQKEHIEENFMLGLSALIAGDFVFLPSDTRICKAVQAGNAQNATLTLFMRVRFFLPSLRGIRGSQARHLLYLQLRRSILEHQLPCSFSQLIELDGLALQAEFGNYGEREHGARDYFLLEHYVPETMSCAIDDQYGLRQELIRSHISKRGLSAEKAEQDFIILAQSLPHYGGHFYTATWMLKDNNHKDVWLYISAQGINLYERDRSTSNCGPQLYEMFEWRSIQTLCYSKQYLCILPHSKILHSSKLKKYKLKMDHKKSYFTFRLASLHHQFFLRLRTEYTSLQTLSQQFGIPLKDMKNETNSLCKLEALTNPNYMALDQSTVNAETEFKIEFRASSKCSSNKASSENKCRRAKSVSDDINEDYQNKENEHPSDRNSSGLVLDSCYLSGLGNINPDKRRGVKMGTRMFSNIGPRVSRSMEAMNAPSHEYLEEMSLQSVSLHCSSTSISRSPTAECLPTNEAYIIDSSVKSCANPFLPDFQESLSETLLNKLNNISFEEERILSTVSVERDCKGSLGLQITEGSDGNVYIQSVILGGPAHLSGNILSGDQVVAVDGQSLLGMKYKNALNLLTNTGRKVEFVLSRIAPSRQSTLRIGDAKVNLSNISESHLKSLRLENTMNKLKRLSYPNNNRVLVGSPVEKHVTESCLDISNFHKYGSSNTSTEVPYHKHIRYEIEPETENVMARKNLPQSQSNTPVTSLNKNISKSCNHIYDEADRAVVVDVIPKNGANSRSLDRKLGKSCAQEDNKCKPTIPPIALPRSLGLSRKWRGPVRYPVTPVKKTIGGDLDNHTNYLSNSDDDQVFI
ncbi:FERM and PDZ domain-containing protein 2 isoform X1 [Tribolium castaneum]|nr:PREDICTED: FERM and PDZ domain-containing protein 2 isoform X1 [Tribolium castaneum]XP_015840719.1 PREDICTED: FERM and PDZ domain-containing protein 2 isoform X1 [Tribolium castaneum]|eukprot:XP_008201547.1 PREDICTED: FERM and PDZ domain-containing protein 2 isoform X1 [Tribolium castaneum]